MGFLHTTSSSKFLFFIVFGVSVISTINGLTWESEELNKNAELLTVGSNSSLGNETSSREARRSVVSGGIFSIITFSNIACNGSADNGTGVGTCMSQRECNKAGGVTTGSCAKNYGVCCSIRVTCSATVTKNNTLFINPGYPSPATGPLKCSVTVQQIKGATALYLEFISFAIRGPSGPCMNDTFTVTQQGSTVTYPVLCGTNTGLHEYIQWKAKSGLFKRSLKGSLPSIGSITLPSFAANTAVLTFTLAAGSDPRYWAIRIVQFKSTDACNAPAGCAEYFSDLSGTVTSYNYNNNQGELISSNTCINQCFRLPTGYCRMTLTEQANTNSFLLPGTAPNDCTTDYLLINGQRYCGDTLGTAGTVTVNAVAGMNYLSISHCSGSTNPDMDLGYSLQYTLQACT